MAKSLVMVFLTTEGKKVSLRVDNVKDNLTKEQVSSAMDSIITKNIFITKSGELKTKNSAEIISKEESKLALD